MQDIVKRGDKHGGDIRNGPHFRCHTRLIKAKKKRVLEVMDENPRLILQEITNTTDVGLGCTSVDKIFKELAFLLKIPKKKPFGKVGQKEKCKEFPQRRQRRNPQQYGRLVFIDEATTEYNPCLARKKVRVGCGEEVCGENLKLSFKSKRINVMIFACVAKKSRTKLILVRSESKRTSVCGCLGLNAFQFVRELHESYVILFI